MRAMEPGMVRRMLDAYDLAWRHIEEQLTVLESRIEAAQARAEVIRPSWLNQQSWYRQVQDSIDHELQRFTAQGLNTIASTQSNAVQIARMVGIDYRAAIDVPFAGR